MSVNKKEVVSKDKSLGYFKVEITETKTIIGSLEQEAERWKKKTPEECGVLKSW